MSSLHDRNGGAGMAAGQQQQAQQVPQQGSASGTSAAPSYAARLHVDCVMTFQGTGQEADRKNDLRISYSSSPVAHADMRACQAMTPVAVNCTISIEDVGEVLHLGVEATAARTPSAPAQEEPARPTEETAEQRARRTAALDAMFGAWKDLEGTPKDGLEYQIETRAEWR